MQSMMAQPRTSLSSVSFHARMNRPAFVRDYGGQGYEQGSSWTRGQGWAVYGFANSYAHTG